jgi:hypothetical protein
MLEDLLKTWQTFKYLGTTVICQNLFREEINSKLNLAAASCLSVQGLKFACSFVGVWNFVYNITGKT